MMDPTGIKGEGNGLIQMVRKEEAVMKGLVCTIALIQEHDVVLARQRTAQIGAFLGMSQQDQVRLATAVSEVGRNALRYAGGGNVEFLIDEQAGMLLVRVSDWGPGIGQLKEVMDGAYKSQTGMGLGLIGSKRLCDVFEVESSGEGTTVTLGKAIARAMSKGEDRSEAVSSRLRQAPLGGPLEAFQQQNQDLMRALAELQARQEDIERLNKELAETNRGVVALYAELEEKAAALSRASDLKSRFLSNVSHELRTPLSSIRSLTRLLLDRTDGELTPEQERQVNYIRVTQESLSEIVNDLLDLAKIESGKVDVKVKRFEVGEMFGALRGMFRPLVEDKEVSLVFEAGERVLEAQTDEGKVTQVLRNLISNAIKFTAKGEIRITVEAEGNPSAAKEGESGSGVMLVFRVRDTGIGIAEKDQERIFEEYTQVDSPTQRKVNGTGLGLPLARKLAELMGGTLTVESAVGAGSVFTFRIPLIYAGAGLNDARLEGAKTSTEQTRA